MKTSPALLLASLLCATGAAEAAWFDPIIADEFCYPVTPFYRDSDGNNVPDTMVHCDVTRRAVPLAQTLIVGAPEHPDATEHYWSGVVDDYDPDYYPTFGASLPNVGYHLGFDFNGNKGGNSDKYDPVFAAANGYVEHVFTGDTAPEWGKVCVLKHYLENDSYDEVWTVYAHLSSSWCGEKGRFVRRGEQIGAIGTAVGKSGTPYLAHLHFEVLLTKPVEFPAGSGNVVQRTYLGKGYMSQASPNSGESDDYPWSHYANPNTFIETRRSGGVTAPCGSSCTSTPATPYFTDDSTALVNNEPAVTLEWNNQSDVDYYQVTKYDTATGVVLASWSFVSATAFVDAGVENGVEIEYELAAVKEAGITSSSNSVTVTPNVAQEPPEDFLLFIGDSRCLNFAPAKNLWWTKSFGAAEYDIYRNGSLVADGVEGREYSDFDIEEATAYTWTVRAINSEGTHAAANSVSDTIPSGACDEPDAPSVTTDVAVEQTLGELMFKGTFNPNGASTYYWFEWGASTGTYTASTTPLNMGAGTSAVQMTFVSWIGCDLTIYYRAAAENDGGTTYGSERNLTTGDCDIATPTNLTATDNGNGTVTVAWTDNSGNEDYFKVEWLPEEGSSYYIRKWASEDATSWVDDFTEWPTSGYPEWPDGWADGEYCYRVAAHSIALGNSGYSNSDCFTKPMQSGGNSHSTDLEIASSQDWSIADSAQSGLEGGGDFSVEIWYKPESQPTINSAAARLFAKLGSSGNRDFYFQYASDGGVRFLDFRVYASNCSTATGGTYNVTLSDGTWYHLAATFDESAGEGEIYINGSSVATLSGMTTSRCTGTTAAFGVGGSQASDTYVDGLLDDARYWSSDRSDTEIANNYDQELSGTDTGLQGYWKFNNDGTDETGSGNDLTNNNSATFSTTVPF